MIERIKGLNKGGKIRLCVFMALLIWCIYLGAGYSYSLEGKDSMSQHLSNSMVDVDDVDNMYIDGSDFTPIVRLMGYGVNGLLSLLYIFFIFLFVFIIVVLSIIPTLVLRFVGLRKKYIVTEDEYIFTKYLYFIAMGISLVLSLILTKLVGIIPCVLFTAAWALILLIYIYGVKARCKMYALSLQNGVPYEQFVGLAPSNKASAPQQPQYQYYDSQKDTYPFTDNLKEFPPEEK